MRASSVALVFVAHLASGFAMGFAGGFGSAALTPFLGLPLGLATLLGAAWFLGKWLFRRDQRPTLIEGIAAAIAAALVSLLGGPIGLILSILNSAIMLLGFRAAERVAAGGLAAGPIRGGVEPRAER